MTLKIVDHDKPGMFCIFVLFLSFFFLNSEVKIHFFFWKIVEYTYGSIHFSGMTESWSISKPSFSNSFSYLKQSTNKTEIKRNKIQYKNTKLYLGHKTVVCSFLNFTRTNKKTNKHKNWDHRLGPNTTYIILGGILTIKGPQCIFRLSTKCDQACVDQFYRYFVLHDTLDLKAIATLTRKYSFIKINLIKINVSL